MSRRRPRKPTKKTAARGYGGEHQKLRKQVARLITAGGVVCWRCGRPILPGMLWDLGHDDWDRTIVRGAEHQACNRAAAGRKATMMQRWVRVRVSRSDADRW
jgi:hypothetical protein